MARAKGAALALAAREFARQVLDAVPQAHFLERFFRARQRGAALHPADPAAASPLSPPR
jgi:hypothetical protein